MSNTDVIERIQTLLGPRQIDCMGIAMAGARHALDREDINIRRASDGETTLYGVIWINDEQKELAKANNFVWFLDVMVEHVGRLEDRPPEIQILPAHIGIYTHDPRLLFDSLAGELYTQWSKEKRFKTAQQWHNPGVYSKPKKAK